jgi:hypothetical protein
MVDDWQGVEETEDDKQGLEEDDDDDVPDKVPLRVLRPDGLKLPEPDTLFDVEVDFETVSLEDWHGVEEPEDEKHGLDEEDEDGELETLPVRLLLKEGLELPEADTLFEEEADLETEMVEDAQGVEEMDADRHGFAEEEGVDELESVPLVLAFTEKLVVPLTELQGLGDSENMEAVKDCEGVTDELIEDEHERPTLEVPEEESEKVEEAGREPVGASDRVACDV